MIDPSKFIKLNVADTCSIWNVLASRLLHGAALSAQVSLCVTEFVHYECLHKPGQPRPERSELQERLKQQIKNGAIRPCSIEIEDLQEVAVLQSRKRLSKGELSSMVFAKKSLQAFMTDDRKAANLARMTMSADNVQSTPHLLAWLYFNGRLQDSDRSTILSELSALKRNLQPHIDNAYTEALRCRLMDQQAKTEVNALNVAN
jgi:predicted nucleic acid-binding protein